jgi:AcrR family transcriptional regulator
MRYMSLKRMTESTNPQPSAGAARRRNPDTQKRILEATLQLVSDRGYSRLTIEGIAARAGVGKATIYRWWASKGALVLDALAQVFPTFTAPDTGDPDHDLTTLIDSVAATMNEGTYAISIPQLAAELSSDPELADEFFVRCVLPNRITVLHFFDRLIDAGTLDADTDIEFLADLIVSIVFFKTLILHRPVGTSYTGDLANLILRERLPRTSG